MTIRGVASVVAACATALAATVTAQQVARDTVAQARPTRGTAAVSGVIVSDERPPRPVRKVNVVLTPTGVDPRTAPAMPGLRVMTDDEGRYVFEGLPAGRYLMTASKGGFVRSIYGAATLDAPPSVIVLADAARFVAQPVTLTRGAVVTGTAFNSSGRPAANVAVELNAVSAGGPRSSPGGTGLALTDDRGSYRIYGLRAGAYIVAAHITGSAPAPALVTPFGAPGTPIESTASNVTYAPVYYPGTTDVTQAAPVTLAAGEERSGIDLRVTLVRTSQIDGTVLDASGNPLGQAAVTLMPALSSLAFFDQPKSAKSNADGTFSIGGVRPGAYTLWAMGNGGWASTAITASGERESGIVLALHKRPTVSGRVVLGGGLFVMTDVPFVSMSFESDSPDKPSTSGMRSGLRAGDSFALDLFPGHYRVSARTSGQWSVKSAVANGRDILDAGLDISDGDIGNIGVYVVPGVTELVGQLIDSANQPAPNFTIHVFSTDRSTWTPNSRRIQSSRASSDGSYRISGLPAGEYYVCALAQFDPALGFDPAFLSEVAAASTKITLADGEKKTQNLRLK